ncbi:hypothetical protein RhiirA5_416940 [Rhizophagus irregularis]|uniref:Uncharacterized protein n=1 Tax=Rhizophagus irregularis TaxID=588596 RepID=A0A2I1EN36_9GLOM|nr:hypothetical protein RhiirA5_416940 [Rhizophagus irregularis]PKY23548.1 hypothetical protein RhiirB3_437785 [Rhizophagus irregularis]
MLEDIISEWARCINYYRISSDGKYKCAIRNIDNQLQNDMLEFVKANDDLVQGRTSTSIIQYHSHAYHTSRSLTEIVNQEESQGFDFFTIK